MANTDYKSPDALMRHLRDNGISISGSSQKQQLINTGYFHGYKGYRFFVSSSNRLPFTSYNEINATIQYDTKLKSLLYGKMMFIETALKNIALNTIMSEIDSSSIYDMYDKAISSYKNAPAGTREDIKKKYQNNKLNLQGSIQNAIAAAYRKENPKITHFYNNVNYNEVPLWAIFEILTMGDFGYLLSCLTIDMREKVSRAIGINLSSDTYRELLYKYVYALKDLPLKARCFQIPDRHKALCLWQFPTLPNRILLPAGISLHFSLYNILPYEILSRIPHQPVNPLA